MIGFVTVDYDTKKCDFLSRIEDALSKQLMRKPRRLSHSYSVARTAEALAVAYGVDPFKARVAGTLHEWSKSMSHDALLARSRELGIDLGVDLELVAPLLHGIVAAKELPSVFPGLGEDVLRAIRVHTLGSATPTPLDQVVFVADGIEPERPCSPGIERCRRMAGTASLDDLYWESFRGGVAYVIETERYLYPGTIDIYNSLALERANKKES